MVDIQAKLLAGKGSGYERWAKVFNLKQMAQTLNYLTENNLLEYDMIVEKAAAATSRYNEISKQIKSTDKRLAEIAVLKTHIINYSRTRDIYIAYRKARYSKKFYGEHASDIVIHKSAKEAFNAVPDKKIPTIKALQIEYTELLVAKKKNYLKYTATRSDMREILVTKANVDRLLGAQLSIQSKETER